MSALALLLALAFAPQGKAPEGAGTVWLAGPEVTPPASERVAMLLVAAPADSPAPLDARDWGGSAASEVLDVRAELGPPQPEALERVRRARRLLLGPGDLAQWRAALWDGPRPSALARALREAWADGAEVAARGAGALVLGAEHLDEDPRALERNPRALTATVARPGLGLCPTATLDGAARGVDPGPLALRLAARELQVGLWLPAAGGVRWEPSPGRWVGFGSVPSLAFDARAARFDAGHAQRVLLEWIAPERVGLARDATRIGEVDALPQIDLVVRARLWDPELWREPIADRAQAWWRTPTGRCVRLVGLPAPEELAPGAWLELEP